MTFQKNLLTIRLMRALNKPMGPSNRVFLPVGVLLGVLSATLVACVQERCYEQYQCSAPKICSPEGLCVYECVNPDDCLAGFTCEDHVCKVKSDSDVQVDGAEPELYCPAGMVLVEQLFCIDAWEATRPDSTSSKPGTDESMAVSRKGAYPWLTSDNSVAAGACTAAGKRLCKPMEWKQACSGPQDTVYSYGDAYVGQACNGIDAFGRTSFHLMPTGSFPECTNDYGVYDMNGNVWEHTLGGDNTDVRGGAYNCSDSKALHKCAYVPGNWAPSALGFRCCQEPLVRYPDDPEPIVEQADVAEPADDAIEDLPSDGFTIPEIPAGDICQQPDTTWHDTIADVRDTTGNDASDATEITDAAHTDQGRTDILTTYSCPADMEMVVLPPRIPFCMDRYEASRSDSTSSAAGISTTPVSEPGRMPWFGATVTQAAAKTACESVSKRLCQSDEWFGTCTGSEHTVYSYGNAYDPAVCNAIDTFCDCDEACAAVAVCPYPHCRTTASPAGDGGPCGASFHVMPTGSFPACSNEWGVKDINGNVWELVDAGDAKDHFRGGAFNCSDSEALHRCDHDADWGPSARGFRCCMNAQDSASGD